MKTNIRKSEFINPLGVLVNGKSFKLNGDTHEGFDELTNYLEDVIGSDRRAVENYCDRNYERIGYTWYELMHEYLNTEYEYIIHAIAHSYCNYIWDACFNGGKFDWDDYFGIYAEWESGGYGIKKFDRKKTRPITKGQWRLQYNDSEETGDKHRLMDRGVELLNGGAVDSCILTDGVTNAKCRWHAGRPEWSDFVPIGEYFTASTKKSTKKSHIQNYLGFSDMASKMRKNRIGNRIGKYRYAGEGEDPYWDASQDRWKLGGDTHVKVYQVSPESQDMTDPRNQYFSRKWFGWDKVKDDFSMDYYNQIWEGDLSANHDLNKVYDMLQDHRPIETSQAIFSLSVGDLVEMDGRLYMVDRYGFTEISKSARKSCKPAYQPNYLGFRDMVTKMRNTRDNSKIFKE